MTGGPSPRGRFITVYGRMPVLEALRDERLGIARLLVARRASGESLGEILAAAARRGIPVRRVEPERVTRVSGNGRHDQGVVADVDAPSLVELDEWIVSHPAAAQGSVLVLDGVTNPANVGMVIRTAAAAGLDGVVVPRAGCPDIGPLVIKASAGVAFFAPVLRTATPSDAVAELRRHGWAVIGMRSADATCLWRAPVGPRTAVVLGSETGGISAGVAAQLSSWISIPLAAGVESLNVASAAAVLCYELVRRRSEAS